jgi:opacity protein-like surface antigen
LEIRAVRGDVPGFGIMKPLPSLIVLGLLLVTGSSPAFGQTPREGRPYRGLFGSGLGESEQSLVANASLAAGYDDNILARGVRNPRSERRGTFGSGTVGVNYAFDRDRVHLGASAGSATRYYPSLPRQFISTENASVGGSLRILNSPAVTITQTAAYHPYNFRSFLLQPFGEPSIGQIEAPDLDLWTTPSHFLVYTGGVGLNQRVSPRGTFDLHYDYRLRQSTGDSRERLTRSAGAGYRHNLTKGLALRLGYGYRVGHYSPSSRRVENHTIDLGFDYSRSLSFSRRTTVSFGTGTTSVARAGSSTDLETSETNSHERTRFHATGNVNLTQEIGRTWAATAQYFRGMRFADTMDEPVFGDSAALGFGGLLSRRLQFQSSARALFRGRALNENRNRFDIYLGTAGLSYALTRLVSLSLNYSYYRYKFESNVPFPQDIASDIGRQSVRVSVNLWAPLFSRERSTTAAP